MPTPWQVALALAPAAISRHAAIPGTSSIEHLEQNVAPSLRLSERRIEKLAGVPELVGSR